MSWESTPTDLPMSTDPTQPLLACTGLTKRLRSGDREITVLDGVDIAVEAGEIVPLRQAGFGKVAQGLTTFAEVIRATKA